MWLITKAALAIGILVLASPTSGLADSITPKPLPLAEGSTLTLSISSAPQVPLSPQTILAQDSGLGSFRTTAGEVGFFVHHPPSLTSGTPPPLTVPEPETMVLFGTGLLAAAWALKGKTPVG